MRFVGKANLDEIVYPSRFISVTTYSDTDNRYYACGGQKVVMTEVDVPDFKDRKNDKESYKRFVAAVSGMAQVAEITGREEVA